MDTHKSFTLSFSNQSVQQRQLEESFRSTVDAAVSPMTDPKLARSLLSNAYAMEQLILCSRSNKRRFMASGLRDDAKTRSHPYPSRRQAPSNHRFALLVSRYELPPAHGCRPILVLMALSALVRVAFTRLGPASSPLSLYSRDDEPTKIVY
ncbi:hypothetical protein BHE74_00009604 [Ensete ventricosum]|nr:hypothetical protein BHE74_00009604 [Ensete ventricosum]